MEPTVKKEIEHSYVPAFRWELSVYWRGKREVEDIKQTESSPVRWANV